jgi:hypothetical protein
MPNRMSRLLSPDAVRAVSERRAERLGYIRCRRPAYRSQAIDEPVDLSATAVS